MRIGVFGGTFDPVHFGHLILAEACRESLDLKEVRFIPAAVSPHKTDRPVTNGVARTEMLTLALSGYPEFVVDRRELKRTGPSFTIDTLRELKSEDSHRELFFLMGADSLRDFLTWKEPQSIAELATIVACNRPGCPVPSYLQITEWVGAEIAMKVICVEIPGTDLSASNLRERAAQGKGLRFRTPRAVETYITHNKLYCPNNT